MVDFLFCDDFLRISSGVRTLRWSRRPCCGPHCVLLPCFPKWRHPPALPSAGDDFAQNSIWDFTKHRHKCPSKSVVQWQSMRTSFPVLGHISTPKSQFFQRTTHQNQYAPLFCWESDVSGIKKAPPALPICSSYPADRGSWSCSDGSFCPEWETQALATEARWLRGGWPIPAAASLQV